MSKIALTTVVSDEFVCGFICMYRSLVKENPAFESYPVFILHNSIECVLSDEGKQIIREHCSHAEFHEIDNDDYAGIYEYAENVIKTPRQLRAAFYILESFRFVDFDAVIAIDSDTIVLGDLSSVLTNLTSFSAVRARNKKDGLDLNFVNTGFMVIGKRYLRDDALELFLESLEKRQRKFGSGKADQAVLNVYFPNDSINYLDERFNYTKRSVLFELGEDLPAELIRRNLTERDIKVLHYVSEKPWHPKVRQQEYDYDQVEILWHETFAEIASPSAVLWMMKTRQEEERRVDGMKSHFIDRLIKGKRPIDKKLPYAQQIEDDVFKELSRPDFPDFAHQSVESSYQNIIELKEKCERQRGEGVRSKRDLKRVIAQLRQAESIILKSSNVPGLTLHKNNNRKLPNDAAICLALNDSFVPGLECLVYSLEKEHDDFNLPIHVFHDDCLSQTNRDYLNNAYKNFVFHQVNQGDYDSIEPHKRIGRTSYYILEAFRLPGYRHVLAMDADIICCGPIGEMFESDQGLSAGINAGETLTPFYLSGCNHPIFNSGVMLLNSEVRNEDAFTRLIEFAAQKAGSEDPNIGRFADQRVLNYAFRDKKVSMLDLSFNAPARLADIYPGFDIQNVSLLHFTGKKPWFPLEGRILSREEKALYGRWQDLYREARLRNRIQFFQNSDAAKRLLSLKDIHKGKRAFILGNGPSLAKQNLSLLKDEITFVGNWFALHENYDQINPDYYCLCSHTIFGGWSAEKPALEENLRELLLTKTANARKFFSFEYQPYLEGESVFPGHELDYLLYEKPLKQFVDSCGRFNLDALEPVHDGHTVVVTFCMLLAHWMGVSEIYLLGCDCDYGIKVESDEKSYFYESNLHTTKTSAFKHLDSVWGDEDARIFKTYRIVREVLEKEGIKVFNATDGGRLEEFPRVELETLFPASREPTRMP